MSERLAHYRELLRRSGAREGLGVLERAAILGGTSQGVGLFIAGSP